MPRGKIIIVHIYEEEEDKARENRFEQRKAQFEDLTNNISDLLSTNEQEFDRFDRNYI